MLKRWCIFGPFSLCLYLFLVGCAGSVGPDSLTIPAGQYTDAFNAALEVARANGMDPILRDRRNGIIETDPIIAGTLLEPWYPNTANLAQGVENTLSQYRMKARFEFIPAGILPDTGRSTAPDLLALGTEPVDLTMSKEPLELRVQVFRERRHTVGQRLHTWSRQLHSNTRHTFDDEEWEETSTVFWTPEARDPAAERRFLSQVARDLSLPQEDQHMASESPSPSR